MTAHPTGQDARFVKIERRLDQPGRLDLQKVRIYGESDTPNAKE